MDNNFKRKGFKPLTLQRIMVTGAQGFFGSYLSRRLQGLGAEVYMISRERSIKNDLQGNWLFGDLSDLDTMRRIMKAVKPDLVFHLAGMASGTRDSTFVVPTLEKNVLPTVNLLLAAEELGGSKIIIASSSEEPKDSSEIPSSPYAASKWVSSIYTKMFHSLYQTHVSIALIFVTYGPHLLQSHKLIPYVILSLLRGETPKLTSGNRMMDLIYIEDMIDGLIALSEAADYCGESVDIGSGKLVQVRTVVESIVRLLGSKIQPEFGAVPERPFETSRFADVSKTSSMIGWSPVTPLEEGLKRTIEWYSSNGGEG
jgi:nucleoside-diphosphate-sugar epimerase